MFCGSSSCFSWFNKETLWPLRYLENFIPQITKKRSDLNEIIEEMFAHMRTQTENPVLMNSRFVFDRVLFLDVSFHNLNLTRGSSHLPLPDWIASKKALINPQNEEDEECFKWAVIAALHYKE